MKECNCLHDIISPSVVFYRGSYSNSYPLPFLFDNNKGVLVTLLEHRRLLKTTFLDTETIYLRQWRRSLGCPSRDLPTSGMTKRKVGGLKDSDGQESVRVDLWSSVPRDICAPSLFLVRWPLLVSLLGISSGPFFTSKFDWSFIDVVCDVSFITIERNEFSLFDIFKDNSTEDKLWQDFQGWSRYSALLLLLYTHILIFHCLFYNKIFLREHISLIGFLDVYLIVLFTQIVQMT